MMASFFEVVWYYLKLKSLWSFSCHAKLENVLLKFSVYATTFELDNPHFLSQMRVAIIP